MVCFSPEQGFEKVGLTKNGKFGFTRNREFARTVNGFPVHRTVPCRKCEGCRHDTARQTATKICHESQLYFDTDAFRNSFITLTYNDDFIPLYGSLNYDDWTNFLKRLRLALAPLRIRYYMIGEYGDLNLRPHYHAIIFGYDFPDKEYHSDRLGNILYRSKFLESLWTVPRGKPFAGASYGFSSIGTVTPASANYVARYGMKKLIGTDRFSHQDTYDEETGALILGRYQRYNQETGDRITVERERPLMSKRPGIGKRWFDSFAMSDLYAKTDIDCYKDHTHLSNGMIVRPPTYYDTLLSRVDPGLLEDIKRARQDHMARHADSFTPELLRQRRECFVAKMKLFKRQIGNVYAT